MTKRNRRHWWQWRARDRSKAADIVVAQSVEAVQDDAEPEVRCLSCRGVCSVDVEERVATCTGVDADGEPCPQQYGFHDERCAHGWYGPFATIFGEIDDPETLTQYLEHRRGQDDLWAALRTRLGKLTAAEYSEVVATSIADWGHAAEKYRHEKGWE